MSTIYSGDVGTILEATLSDDITGYSIIRIDIKKPDGQTVEKIATLVDALQGIISIVTVASDVDLAGNYCFIPYVEFSASKKFFCKPLKKNIQLPC